MRPTGGAGPVACRHGGAASTERGGSRPRAVGLLPPRPDARRHRPGARPRCRCGRAAGAPGPADGGGVLRAAVRRHLQRRHRPSPRPRRRAHRQAARARRRDARPGLDGRLRMPRPRHRTVPRDRVRDARRPRPLPRGGVGVQRRAQGDAGLDRSVPRRFRRLPLSRAAVRPAPGPCRTVGVDRRRGARRRHPSGERAARPRRRRPHRGARPAAHPRRPRLDSARHRRPLRRCRRDAAGSGRGGCRRHPAAGLDLLRGCPRSHRGDGGRRALTPPRAFAVLARHGRRPAARRAAGRDRRGARRPTPPPRMVALPALPALPAGPGSPQASASKPIA